MEIVKPKQNNPKMVVIHHTGTNNSFEQDNLYHKQKWPQFPSSTGYYLGYHYWLSKSGKIKQARPENEEAAHTKGANCESIGIALQGNFSKEGEYPTESQIVSLKALLRSLMTKYSIPFEKIKPHRYFAQTECAGKNLTDEWFAETFAELNVGQEENLKKKIGIIKKLIAIYQKLLEIIKGQQK